MSIRFAPARTPARSALARALTSSAEKLAANDQAPEERDPQLEIALRHFARHGMAAVAAALAQADRASDAGDTRAREEALAIAAMFGRPTPRRN